MREEERNEEEEDYSESDEMREEEMNEEEEDYSENEYNYAKLTNEKTIDLTTENDTEKIRCTIDPINALLLGTGPATFVIPKKIFEKEQAEAHLIMRDIFTATVNSVISIEQKDNDTIVIYNIHGFENEKKEISLCKAREFFPDKLIDFFMNRAADQ